MVRGSGCQGLSLQEHGHHGFGTFGDEKLVHLGEVVLDTLHLCDVLMMGSFDQEGVTANTDIIKERKKIIWGCFTNKFEAFLDLLDDALGDAKVIKGFEPGISFNFWSEVKSFIGGPDDSVARGDEGSIRGDLFWVWIEMFEDIVGGGHRGR